MPNNHFRREPNLPVNFVLAALLAQNYPVQFVRPKRVLEHIVKYLFFLLILFASELTMACSCGYDRTIEEVAKDSHVIFYGELIGVEKVGKIVKTGNEQEYKVTIHPQKVLKGKAKTKYRFKGHSIYNDKDVDEVTVGGCGLDMELGGKYIIMIEKGKNNTWSWCEQRILPKGSKQFKYFINNIQTKL